MTRRKRQLLNTAEDLRQPGDLGNVAPFEPRRDTVGDLLRRAREGKRWTVEEVAQHLRIRAGYLKAIEEGRFQDLPGLTYAVGFVRTYADHLGLDAEDVVRRFRDEVTELQGQTHLVFPVVAAEGKIPRGAVLLLSAVLLAIAYGGWYYLSEREQSALDLIPELPAKLKALVYGDEPENLMPPVTQTAATAPAPTVIPAPAATPPQPSAEPAAPVPASPTAAAGEGQLADPAPPAAPAVPESAVPVPESLPDTTAGATAGADDDAVTAALMSQGATGGGNSVNSAATATVAPTQPAPPATAAEPPPQAAPSAELPAAPDVAASTTPAPALDSAGLPTVAAPVPATGSFAAIAPNEPQGLPPVGDGQAFGATDAASRIVLVARLESWVQVTDPETNALLTRVLRAGDRYYVPDAAGLNLATGNAGGLDIWVDGQKIPALGPVGVVRRGIALDPQRLANGTALPE